MAEFSKVQQGFELILEGLGCDLKDPHFAETPNRAAKALYYELCAGVTMAEPEITTFPTEKGSTSGMIISKGIPVRSLCAHHFLPFVGEAVVGYIPDEKILGLSKMSRIVNYWARRPQVQEQLTSSVADDLVKRLYAEGAWKPGGQGDYFPIPGQCGVGVVIKARHMCMEIRGINHPSAVVTSALRGVFLEAEVRAEFLHLAEGV